MLDGRPASGVHGGVTALWIAGLLAGCGAKSHLVTEGEADTDSDADADAGAAWDAAPQPDPDDCDYEPPIDPGRECIPRFENTPPTAPVPIRPADGCIDYDCPIFAVENAFDADGDVLRVHLAIDWDPNFRSTDLQETAPEGIPEDPSGVTEWLAPRPLLPQPYYWRTWVDDCIEESDHVISILRPCDD